MTRYTFYHNPKCSKSRAALAILQEKNIDFTTILYLTDTLTTVQLEELIAKLNIKPINLVRNKESAWLDISNNEQLSDNDIMALLAKEPKLIERPILANKHTAVIGRPTENILALLEQDES